VYLRETKRRNRDGSTVSYLQLAHSERLTVLATPSAQGVADAWPRSSSGERGPVQRRGSVRAWALLSLRRAARQVDILAAGCGAARAWQRFHLADVSAHDR